MAESKMYLTVSDDPRGRGKLAIVTLGHPQRGDAKCEVLTLTVVKDHAEACAWYERMKIERPWETRQ